ncbi:MULTISPECIES: nucleotidyl transferase AbiEii/AbiGii toxin family protein [Nitrosospira]|uniref:Predicted nucleotidyltransferase component of viral defense system n=1 Tax=Nitrosospira multiformis TaxID=1231 RepID=A0ABY0TGH9_9PROT|nr:MULTISPECIES: nucleotidyl transferase AbiEii/AbiGii toxin family protein [Nitrosospira]SDQ79463.1 Predicted nucleotidyltransferase component of viral defense system [Nitrosospira multiformis]
MIDLQAWVESEDQIDRKTFRRAVQLILRGIAQSPILSSIMIMKGGVLLAIRYQSSRFTRDIDFSTSQRIQDVDIPALLNTIKEALVPISADNEYALALRLQSHEIRPPNRPDVSFPTLQMRIGYVSRLEPRSMKRLEATGSAQVVQVDYSFNEWASETEKESIDGGSLSMYTFHDLIAEKLRSVLQQPIRERGRYQDIYDLFLLLQIGHPPEEADREAVFRKLLEACRERQVPLHRAAMRDPKVIGLSNQQYSTALPSLISGELPSFDTAYSAVQNFFESLPWDTMTIGNDRARLS